MTEIITPKSPLFWGAGLAESKTLTREEKTKLIHTYKAISIAAEAHASALRGGAIIEKFPELYQEIYYIRVLNRWDCPATEDDPEEYKELLAQIDSFALSGEAMQENEEDFDLSGEVESNIREEDCVCIERFIKIMSTDPDNITDDMKQEAFQLFSHVILFLGSV